MEDVFVADRDRDFVEYVAEQVAERRAAEDAFYAGADARTGGTAVSTTTAQDVNAEALAAS